MSSYENETAILSLSRLDKKTGDFALNIVLGAPYFIKPLFYKFRNGRTQYTRL